MSCGFSGRSKYTASGDGDQKSITVQEEDFGDSDDLFVTLTFCEGANFVMKHVLDPPEALAMADVLNFVAEQGLKMGLETGPARQAQGVKTGHNDLDTEVERLIRPGRNPPAISALIRFLDR